MSWDICYAREVKAVWIDQAGWALLRSILRPLGTLGKPLLPKLIALLRQPHGDMLLHENKKTSPALASLHGLKAPAKAFVVLTPSQWEA